MAGGILGQEVQQFEAELAEHMKLPFAVGCASGLDALEIGLRVLDVPPDGKVLTTPLSAFASTLAIIRAGGQPVFVDVDDYGLMDLEQAEEMLQADPEIKHMLPVHLFGHSLNLTKLEHLRDTYDLKIVEDCAQSIGAGFGGEVVGTVGQVAATSFYPTKNLGAMGDGGALLVQDESLRDHAQSLRDYGQTAKYEHSMVGLNSRLDELQAAILSTALLPGLHEMTIARSNIASTYLDSLNNAAVLLPGAPPSSESVWHLFPVLIEGSRDKFETHLKKNGIMTGRHYPFIIPDQEAMKSVAKYESTTDFPNARDYATSEVSIPIHPFMSDEDTERVVAAVNSWTP